MVNIMKHIFIINPKSGNKKALTLIPLIKSSFSDIQDEYEILITKYPGHGTELSRKYCQDDKARLYAVGGDGTINEVLNAVAEQKCSMGIIPAGSGNDFFRTIYYDNNDIKNLIKLTINGAEELYDVGKINNKYYVNITSVGFDADVLKIALKLKRYPLIHGSFLYLVGAIVTSIGYKCKHYELTIDGKKLSGDYLMITAANGRYYGGGMSPTPKADPQDGMLDICLISKISNFKILRFMNLFIKGTHGIEKEVSFYRAKNLTIHSESEITLNIDGELFFIREAVFELIPSGVKIVRPN